MSGERITLTVEQSLALRLMIDTLKGDDTIYTACPEVIRNAFCDFYMPVYSDAEAQIAAMKIDREMMLRTLDKFAHRIHELEKKLSERSK